MHTRFPVLTLCVVMLATPVFGQISNPIPLKTLATSAEVQAAIAKAPGERKNNANQVSEPLASVAPYRINLEYRFDPNIPTVHETTDEIFYFIQGTGNVTIGGTLVNPTQATPVNIQGPSIQGGTQLTVNKGDILIVPQGSPHLLVPVGGPLVDLVLNVPGPSTQTPPPVGSTPAK